MTEARRLLKMFEADPTDYDKNLLKALGIQSPDDWDDHQPAFNHYSDSDKRLLQQSPGGDHIVSSVSLRNGSIGYIMRFSDSSKLYLKLVDAKGRTFYPTVYGDGSLGWDFPERVPAYLKALARRMAPTYLELDHKAVE